MSRHALVSADFGFGTALAATAVNGVFFDRRLGTLGIAGLGAAAGFAFASASDRYPFSPRDGAILGAISAAVGKLFQAGDETIAQVLTTGIGGAVTMFGLGALTDNKFLE